MDQRDQDPQTRHLTQVKVQDPIFGWSLRVADIEQGKGKKTTETGKYHCRTTYRKHKKKMIKRENRIPGEQETAERLTNLSNMTIWQVTYILGRVNN